MPVPLGWLLGGGRIMAFPRPIHFYHSFSVISPMTLGVFSGDDPVHQLLRCVNPCNLTIHNPQQGGMVGQETFETKRFWETTGVWN